MQDVQFDHFQIREGKSQYESHVAISETQVDADVEIDMHCIKRIRCYATLRLHAKELFPLPRHEERMPPPAAPGVSFLQPITKPPFLKE